MYEHIMLAYEITKPCLPAFWAGQQAFTILWDF